MLKQSLPVVRSAYSGDKSGPNEDERRRRALSEQVPALLVSYVYLEGFLRLREAIGFRDWSMDSGAFSAHNAGKVVSLSAYIDCCRSLLGSDAKLTEVFALDVIGDWRASMKNTEAMWAAGVPAIPTYHYGEPERVLIEMAAQCPKIALGGAVFVPFAKKLEWVRQCFARVWPKRIHGLGMASEQLLMAVPFHSTDASSWEIAPTAYGNSKAYGRISVRGGRHDLRAEVRWYLDLEARVRHRWRYQMRELEAV